MKEKKKKRSNFRNFESNKQISKIKCYTKLGSVENPPPNSKSLQNETNKPASQTNTTLGIIQKNLDFKLNIDMEVDGAPLHELESDKDFMTEQILNDPIEVDSIVDVTNDIINDKEDIDHVIQDILPLESVLLPEDQSLFADSLDLTDIKVIISGHDQDTITEANDELLNLEDNLRITSPPAKCSVRSMPRSKRKGDVADPRVWHMCDVCDKQFSDRSTLKRHTKSIHSVSKSYACNNCDKTFSLQSYLTQHVQSQHSDVKWWICHVCGSKFKSKKGVQTHLLIHQDGTKNIECTECDAKFRHKSTLVKHKKRIHTKGQSGPGLICDVCSKYFSHTEGLKRHKQKVHSNIRPFSCAQCFQTFAFQYDLNKHTKLKSCVRKGTKVSSYPRKRQRNGKTVPTDPLECSADPSSNENVAGKLPILAPKLTRVEKNSCLSNIVMPENVVVFAEDNLNFKE